ncbi:LADA_0H17524g1_1 [Lachancea dasiensis]|uniref:LADA_0H17524g1_1 n=1 Tax=Lachancea dasiensis TaxID=1072105 RepID=A0A1G4K5N7_9SACH|nr:LADA_0H17524g1_1 [Lachancea dasiensis]
MTLQDKVLMRNVQYRGRLYDRFPKVYNIYVLGVVACISGLMFGFDISSMSSMIGTTHYKEYFNNPGSTEQGGITASMSAGSFAGSLISSHFSDVFGRRVSLHLCASLWILGAILQSASQDVAMLVAGRVISGMGIGFGSSAAPVYCSEISPPRIRGTICGLFQFSVTMGIMILFYIGYGCHFINGQGAFRVTWGIQIVPGLVLLIAAFFLPESPRWLANNDRWEEASEVVAQVGARGNREDPQVKLQLEEIKEQVILDTQVSFGYRQLFRKKTLNKTIVGISAQMWQQLCGMNVMMYYIVFIFQMAGYSGDQVLVSGSIQYVLNVVMTIPALFLVDKVGRRPVLLVGGIFMFIWLFVVAGLLATYSVPAPEGFDGDETVTIRIPEDHKGPAKGVIAASYLFVCSFAPTWGIGIWIYCSEIFNNVERAKGSALCASVNWAFNFALAMFVPPAFKNISWKTYIIFGVFSVCLTIQTFFMFPETKGKTLEEIDQMWEDRIPAWKTGSYVPELPVIEDEEGNKLGLLANAQHIENAERAGNISNEKPLFEHRDSVENSTASRSN